MVLEFVKAQKVLPKLILSVLVLLGFILGISTQANAATYSISPTSVSFVRQCEYILTVQIDVTGESSNAAEIEVSYNTDQIDIIDRNSSAPGIQVGEGNAYQTYVFNEVNESAGTIKVAAANFLGTLSTNAVFAEIYFQSTATANVGQFDIAFDGVGASQDSNIADSTTNNDLLTAVTNGTYTFVDGSCTNDETRPNINFVSPRNNARGVPAEANVSLRLTDDDSGINLDETEFIINSVKYLPTDPEVTITGTPTNYSVTINPNEDFSEDSANTVVVSTEDNAENTRSRQIIFNVPQPVPPPPPPVDTTPPTIIFGTPTNQQIGFVEGNLITFDILDDESGVDIDTIEIFLNDEAFNSSDNDVSFTGEPSNYNFQLNSDGNINDDAPNFLRILAADLDGNTVNRQIVFNIPNPVPEVQECIAEAINDTPVTDVNGEQREASVLSCNLDSPINSVSTDLDEFFNNNFDGTPLENLRTTDVWSGISIAFLGLLALPLLNLIALGGLLFRVIGFYIGRRVQNPWGVIVDGFTSKPIAFAVCEIYVESSQFKLSQTVSDLEGRYGFSLSPGSYRLSIKQSGYEVYSEKIEISKGEKTVINDVSLVPLGKRASGNKLNKRTVSRINKSIENASQYFFRLGFIFSIFTFLLTGGIFNGAILAIYTIIFLLSFLINYSRNRNKTSSVINSENDLRIPFAQIKIFDTTDWKLIDSITTNFNGQFDFYGKPGTYGILVAARGYDFPSRANKYPVSDDKFGGIILVDLKRGNNRIDIYVDPSIRKLGPSPFSK